MTWITGKSPDNSLPGAGDSSSAQPEDAALAAAGRRSPEAFGQLYRRYVQRVYRYIYSLVHDALEAEDLTAEVFMAALEGLDGYQEQGSFAAWLFAIARNKTRAHFRRDARRRAYEAPGGEWALEAIGQPWNPLVELEAAERRQRLQAHIQALSPEDRELLRLRFAADLTFAEIAQVLGRKEPAVKMSLYRLLARLGRDLENEHE